MAKPLTHSYSSLKQYENCPKQFYMQRVSKEVKQRDSEASMYGERIHTQLEQRAKGSALPSESAKYEVLVRAFEAMPGELAAEVELTLNAQLQATGWWDEDAWLRSKLDILIRNGVRATMADWKTGKRRPDWFQLDLFAMQIFKHYPEITDVTACFVWLKDKQMDVEFYSKDQAPTLWNKFMEKVQRIEASLKDNNWPAKPSGLCPWCPAKHLCPYARV